jgi:hypothetical protein
MLFCSPARVEALATRHAADFFENGQQGLSCTP